MFVILTTEEVFFFLSHREGLPITNVTATVNAVEIYHKHRIKLERIPMCPEEKVKKEKREDEFDVHCTIKKPVNHGESPVVEQILQSRMSVCLRPKSMIFLLFSRLSYNMEVNDLF